MTELNHQINLALRTAAGHARAANDVQAQADKAYEMKMKSAGAAVYEAWGLAVRAQPEYQGRKIDDKALERIYTGTTPRPWWDKHLTAVKVDGKPADREWAKRTMQWHLDPDAAKERAARHVARSEGHRRKVKEAAARPQPGNSGRTCAPSTKEVRELVEAVERGRGYGTQSGPIPAAPTPVKASRNAAINLIERARAAVLRLSDPVALAEAEDLIRDLVDQLEAL